MRYSGRGSIVALRLVVALVRPVDSESIEIEACRDKHRRGPAGSQVDCHLERSGIG